MRREMNGGFGRDLIVAALVVSVLVHIGLMIWARPKVMTQMIAAGLTNLTHRVMAVHEAPPPNDAVKLDILEDVQAVKDAPEAAETVAAIPALETALPAAQEAEAAKVLPSVTAPEIVSRLNPTEESLSLPLPSVAESAADLPRVAMPVETLIPEAVTAAPGAALPVQAEVVAPSFEAPKFAAVPTLGLPDAGAVVGDAPVMIEEAKEAGEEFTPIEEVMVEVDEKAVEKEKAAVRDLIDSVHAADLAEVVDVALAAETEDEYTYFRATVRPKTRIPTVPKDVVIIIDASGSIGRDRLTSCRKAAHRILRTCTNTGDRFNLVAFRDRFSYAFKTWQECNAKSFDVGDKWLDGLVAHGRTDVFSTIASVLTLPRDPARPLIALVVTDGDANVGVKETAQIISKFSALNDGLVSVYMYGVKSNANRELIDVLTRSNRGESFIFSGWFRQDAGDKIDALSERFRDPVLSDLRLIFATTCKAEAYPRLLKNLYRGNLVEIIGRVPKGTSEVAFSLKALAGTMAYEGYFKLPLAGAARDSKLAETWRAEQAIDAKLR